MKINLKNIKVAIFDFDDTLAIHRDIEYLQRRNENEVLFVDDIEENIVNFNKIGINAFLPDDVDLLIE